MLGVAKTEPLANDHAERERERELTVYEQAGVACGVDKFFLPYSYVTVLHETRWNLVVPDFFF